MSNRWLCVYFLCIFYFPDDIGLHFCMTFQDGPIAHWIRCWTDNSGVVGSKPNLLQNFFFVSTDLLVAISTNKCLIDGSVCIFMHIFYFLDEIGAVFLHDMLRWPNGTLDKMSD